MFRVPSWCAKRLRNMWCNMQNRLTHSARGKLKPQRKKKQRMASPFSENSAPNGIVRPSVLKALFDSNILIDYLIGIAAAKKEFQLYESRAISVVTWMEVMASGELQADAITRGFLSSFEMINVTEPIAERAIKLRRERRMKLPDAIILASAIEHGLLLITRNTKDFDAKLPNVRMPYALA